MAQGEIGDDVREGLQERWHRFIDAIEPLRPDLFRFGLALTGNAFDAEDLVHDGMLRAFGSLAFNQHEVRSPRSYLLRILSNLWVDQMRRARPEVLGDEAGGLPDALATAPDETTELRDAARVVLGALSPRERAAVVLKEGFDLSHAEIAELLLTTPGAVKVALHRGRKRLAAHREAADRPSRVSRELVDHFVEIFLTYDMDRVKALVTEHVEASVFPNGLPTGRELNARQGWLFGCFYHHSPEREAAREPYPLELEVREVQGEPAVLVFRDRGGRALEEVWRFEEEDGLIARVKDYCFSPDLVRWVGDHFGLPSRAVGYRARPGAYEGGPS